MKVLYIRFPISYTPQYHDTHAIRKEVLPLELLCQYQRQVPQGEAETSVDKSVECVISWLLVE